jgi:acyl-CoA synthetase (AMP-forming)/AMP-acid ligase II
MSKIVKVSELLIERASRDPERPFITDLNRSLTLTNLQVALAVSELRIKWGAPGRVVMAFMEGGTPDAVVWLVALAGGYELIPLSPEASLQTVEEIAETRKPTLVINKPRGTKAGWRLNNAVHARVELNSLLSSLPQDFTALIGAPDNGSVVLSTSGSTGKPKLLVLSAQRLLVSAKQIAKVHELTADDRGMTVLPLFHINAPVVSLLTSVVSGGQVLFAKKHSSTNFWKWVKQYQPTWISLVPAVATMLLQIPKPQKSVTENVRFVRSASAPLAAATLKSFEHEFGLPLIETYGISEAAATIASNPLPPAEHKISSVGKPVPGIEMRVCESNSLHAVDQGTIGEVCINGEAVIERYEAGRGNDSFEDGWLRTGDLGYFDEDGYLFLVGRSKDIIIRGGENIFPVEIESVILEQPWIREVAVVGKHDSIYGEAIVAFVGTSAKRPDRAQLEQHLKQRLTSVQQPSEIHFLSALPKTSSNKIDKVALREVANRGEQTRS